MGNFVAQNAPEKTHVPEKSKKMKNQKSGLFSLCVFLRGSTGPIFSQKDLFLTKLLNFCIFSQVIVLTVGVEIAAGCRFDS